jgi:hypothetical protein
VPLQTNAIFRNETEAKRVYDLFTSGPDPALPKNGSQIDKALSEIARAVYQYRCSIQFREWATSPAEQRADAKAIMEVSRALLDLIADESRFPPTIKALADEIEQRPGHRLPDLLDRTAADVADLYALVTRTLLRFDELPRQTKPPETARNNLVRDLIAISTRYRLHKSPRRESELVKSILVLVGASRKNLTQVIRATRTSR